MLTSDDFPDPNSVGQGKKLAQAKTPVNAPKPVSASNKGVKKLPPLRSDTGAFTGESEGASEGASSILSTENAHPEIIEKNGGKSYLKKFWPLLLLIALTGLVISMGWHKYLTLEEVARNRNLLKTFIETNFLLSILAYMGLYIVVVALSVPGGAVLTLAGGLLFGWLVGASVTVIGATIGATIIFLAAKSSLSETLAARAGPFLNKLRAGFQENALSYLLFLRLVPAFPFWLVNLAPGLLGVPLRTYVLGTFFGIIPGTVAYSIAGSGLDSVIEAQEASYKTCIAEKGASGGCAFSLDPSALITKEILIAFVALGLVALIPIILKRFRKA